MNLALWVLQILWGAFFIVSGGGKALCFRAALWERALQQIPWLPGVPRALFVFIGVSEFLGGLGLILPAITRVKPRLTPLAAAGLAAVMILASAFHLVRGEFAFMCLTLVLGAVAGFVAYGRLVLKPIAEEPITQKAVLKGLAATVVALLLVFGTLPK
jgi:hypothetical protein